MSIKLSKSLNDKSLEDYTLVAIIEGGKYNKNYVFVSDKSDSPFKNIKKNIRIKIVIPDGVVTPLLNSQGPSRCLIAGPTKSGKSYLLNKMLKLTSRPIYLFSALDFDPSIDDGLDINRIDCNSLLESDFDMSALEDGIVVFDDAETFKTKSLNSKVLELNNHIFERGRHHCPSTIKTSHFLLNGDKTRQGLLECNFIVMFHRGGMKYQVINYLKDRLGFSKPQIETILSEARDSRWIALYTDHPMTLLTEHSVELIQ